MLKKKGYDVLEENIQWQNHVSIFKNSIILKQLGLAVGIPFGLVIAFLSLSSNQSIYLLYSIGLIGGLLIFTWIFIMIVYGGQYQVEFVVNHQGIYYGTKSDQERKSRIINSFLVVAGLLTRKPSLAGAGLLAQSRQSIFIAWKEIKKIKYIPRQHTILLSCKGAQKHALFCTRGNYNEVMITVQKFTNLKEVK